ncbi:hypothetical protein SAMN02910289_01313 [Lachnospiraceae bacterium RM5]|nr:hypothetical protein SAMN02910289_01313 [Lachnospiraceae bacterium RM5]
MSKMVKCKHCGQEIAKSAKVCPGCGGKNKKPFYKKWWFWVIIIFFVLPMIAGLSEEDGDNKTKETTINTTVATTKQSIENKTTTKATEKTKEKTTTKAVETTTAAETTTEVEVIGENFKKAMDDYEEFMDSYCEFMKKYDESDIALAAEYVEWLSKYNDMMKSFEKWADDDSLNAAELAYYEEVNIRVSAKLIDAGMSVD